MRTPIRTLLAPSDIDRLRTALNTFTVGTVHEALGPVGQAAHARGDLDGVARQIRERAGEATVTLVTLFLLGGAVPESAARAAFAPLPLETAREAGLVVVAGGEVRALLEIRPYAEQLPTLPGDTSDDASGDATDEQQWWVVSDLGSDVRPGPLASDHVLGIGGASLTLAQATPRDRVTTALDVGTGCGVQALHLARHASSVTATDVSSRALRFAATTAALSGQAWQLRAGSLFEPVGADRFDLVVANPPFVVSDGAGGYDYRDGGLAGDGICRALAQRLPAHLAPDGVGQLLANWIVPADGDWQERVGGWLAGRGCDAWVWQREVAEPGEYVAMWLRDAGESPGTARWTSRYDAWLDWFVTAGVVGVGMGMITMWRTDADDPVLVLEDVPQAVEQPVGPHLGPWVQRQRRLAAASDATLLEQRLRLADGVVRSRDDLQAGQGWATVRATLRQSHGMRWEVEVDEAIAAVIGACDGTVALRVPLTLLAATLPMSTSELAAAALPALRDLVSRGFLVPEPR